MLQNDTKTEDTTPLEGEIVTDDKVLTQAQEQYISYKAVGGLGVKTGEPLVKVSMHEFANMIGVSRMTLYRWEESIPNFWERVKNRRQELIGRDMISNVWNRVYLDAMAGKEPQQRLILGQFADWKPPAQAHDIKMTGWADVINKARQRKNADATDTNN